MGGIFIFSISGYYNNLYCHLLTISIFVRGSGGLQILNGKGKFGSISGYTGGPRFLSIFLSLLLTRLFPRTRQWSTHRSHSITPSPPILLTIISASVNCLLNPHENMLCVFLSSMVLGCVSRWLLVVAVILYRHKTANKFIFMEYL